MGSQSEPCKDVCTSSSLTLMKGAQIIITSFLSATSYLWAMFFIMIQTAEEKKRLQNNGGCASRAKKHTGISLSFMSQNHLVCLEEMPKSHGELASFIYSTQGECGSQTFNPGGVRQTSQMYQFLL